MSTLPIIWFWSTVILTAVLMIRFTGLDGGMIIVFLVVLDALNPLSFQIETKAKYGEIGCECLLWPILPGLLLAFDIWKRGWRPRAKCKITTVRKP